VKCPGQLPHSTSGVFLNISGLDFGVEADRIARIHVDDGAIVLDGETYGSRLVDRPVGLFEVGRFADAFEKGDEFIPDILFLSGSRIEGPAPEIVAKLYEFCGASNRPLRSSNENERWDKCKTRLALCPVARQLVTRHLAQEALLRQDDAVKAAGPPNCSVFISATDHNDDLAIAHRILGHLSNDGSVGPVFLYNDSPMSMEGMRRIENELLSASTLIVVCTNVDRVRSLDFVWQPYFTWLRYGRKKVGQIVPVVYGIEPHELPLPLCALDSVRWNPDDLSVLKLLSRTVS
jgi:hypothetical protein